MAQKAKIAIVLICLVIGLPTYALIALYVMQLLLDNYVALLAFLVLAGPIAVFLAREYIMKWGGQRYDEHTLRALEIYSRQGFHPRGSQLQRLCGPTARPTPPYPKTRRRF